VTRDPVAPRSSQARHGALRRGLTAPHGRRSGTAAPGPSTASRARASASREPGAVRAAVDRAGDLHGRLDGAFDNGAAIQHPGPLDRTSDADVQEQCAVSSRGHWTAMVAEAACRLLSDRASAVTGAIVPVDGGAGA